MSVIWFLFFAYVLISPMIKKFMLERQRVKKIRSIEKKHNSRLITLIHRQESIGLLGVPLSRYINIEDSEAILRAVRFTPEDMPIEIVLHTPGGLALAAEQIATALSRHSTRVTVYVPHYAMSGGTLIVLSADEIKMDDNAVLGPVDPQLGEYPAVSILKVLQDKNINEIGDHTLIMADVARKAVRQIQNFVTELLKKKMDEERAKEISTILTSGTWTHDYPISCKEMRKMGIEVCCDIPKEIYELMELYPQPAQRRPSVQYVPIPYDRGNNDTRT